MNDSHTSPTMCWVQVIVPPAGVHGNAAAEAAYELHFGARWFGFWYARRRCTLWRAASNQCPLAGAVESACCPCARRCYRARCAREAAPTRTTRGCVIHWTPASSAHRCVLARLPPYRARAACVGHACGNNTPIDDAGDSTSLYLPSTCHKCRLLVAPMKRVERTWMYVRKWRWRGDTRLTSPSAGCGLCCPYARLPCPIGVHVMCMCRHWSDAFRLGEIKAAAHQGGRGMVALPCFWCVCTQRPTPRRHAVCLSCYRQRRCAIARAPTSTTQTTLTAIAVMMMVAVAMLRVGRVQLRPANRVRETVVRMETGSGTKPSTSTSPAVAPRMFAHCLWTAARLLVLAAELAPGPVIRWLCTLGRC